MLLGCVRRKLLGYKFHPCSKACGENPLGLICSPSMHKNWHVSKLCLLNAARQRQLRHFGNCAISAPAEFGRSDNRVSPNRACTGVPRQAQSSLAGGSGTVLGVRKTLSPPQHTQLTRNESDNLGVQSETTLSFEGWASPQAQGCLRMSRPVRDSALRELLRCKLAVHL